MARIQEATSGAPDGLAVPDGELYFKKSVLNKLLWNHLSFFKKMPRGWRVGRCYLKSRNHNMELATHNSPGLSIQLIKSPHPHKHPKLCSSTPSSPSTYDISVARFWTEKLSHLTWSTSENVQSSIPSPPPLQAEPFSWTEGQQVPELAQSSFPTLTNLSRTGLRQKQMCDSTLSF